MKESSLAIWVQVLSAVAILAGLALVIFELNQTRQLANAQLYGDRISDWMYVRGTTLSENFSSVRAKACFNPTELSNAEYFEMYEFHTLLLAFINQAVEIQTITGFTNSNSWQDAATSGLKIFLSTSAGKADFELYKETIRPEVRQLAEHLIATNQIDNCSDHMGAYINRARSLAEDPQ
jgi:hypothetical protein